MVSMTFFIASILVKKSPNLYVLLRRVNDMLHDLCRMKSLGYVCNDAISTEHDEMHLQNFGIKSLSSNFY